jgi:hypothetical protein
MPWRSTRRSSLQKSAQRVFSAFSPMRQRANQTPEPTAFGRGSS